MTQMLRRMKPTLLLSVPNTSTAVDQLSWFPGMEADSVRSGHPWKKLLQAQISDFHYQYKRLPVDSTALPSRSTMASAHALEWIPGSPLRTGPLPGTVRPLEAVTPHQARINERRNLINTYHLDAKTLSTKVSFRAIPQATKIPECKSSLD